MTTDAIGAVRRRLIDVAAADDRTDDREKAHPCRRAGSPGLRPTACDILVSGYVPQIEGGD